MRIGGRGRGYGAGRRWAVVAALVAVLAALPALIGALPAGDAAVSAGELRRAVLASSGVGFSGYAQSSGGLSLPVSQQLTSVADLFSDRTSMRVWWRGPADNRVDVVTPGGETDTYRAGGATWTWDYESATATRAQATPLALPAAADLLPSALGRRLLSEAGDDELTRVAPRRVAGRDGLGLRLRPSAPASSVSAVDVWVDRDTGLPLRVEVQAKGATQPALETAFLDLDLTAPPVSVTAFTPPPDARLRRTAPDAVLREASSRIRPVPLPGTLAGLERRSVTGAPAGIGLYGRGVTLLAVAPLPGNLADGLRRTLSAAPDAVSDDRGLRAAAGPLGLMLVEPPTGGTYLVTGTVTLDALAAAGAQLLGAGSGR